MSDMAQFVPQTPGGYLCWALGAAAGWLCGWTGHQALITIGLPEKVSTVLVVAIAPIVLLVVAGLMLSWSRYIASIFIGATFGIVVWCIIHLPEHSRASA